MGKYLYWPVAGAAVFWREPSFSIAKAKKALPDLRKQFRLFAAEFEIERVMLLNSGGRRYWRWRAGKWTQGRDYDFAPSDISKWH